AHLAEVEIQAGLPQDERSNRLAAPKSEGQLQLVWVTVDELGADGGLALFAQLHRRPWLRSTLARLQRVGPVLTGGSHPKAHRVAADIKQSGDLYVIHARIVQLHRPTTDLELRLGAKRSRIAFFPEVILLAIHYKCKTFIVRVNIWCREVYLPARLPALSRETSIRRAPRP